METILDEKKAGPSQYLKKDLLSNAIQLNEHLSRELDKLQEYENSRVSNRVIRLAEATSKITECALTQISDIDAIIKNTMC
ncbi:hypothetical protein [Candidatus Enterococcus ferrettii]|uniref:Uncharacterized protein n=1 Tax=Candidatus Enterococcus ferrettii TaxID=2815324 RepID=A0ABV0EI36_9ENTE|nr:hypothetical protein [Enterococcus sp. 665A]MBO1341854.1 hypothetical protein [Enterococcus sp. 665A]